eukprot:9705215-Alexandrium_andersonii.AAC.1
MRWRKAGRCAAVVSKPQMPHRHQGAAPWELAGRESTSPCRAAVAGVRGCATKGVASDSAGSWHAPGAATLGASRLGWPAGPYQRGLPGPQEPWRAERGHSSEV